MTLQNTPIIRTVTTLDCGLQLYTNWRSGLPFKESILKWRGKINNLRPLIHYHKSYSWQHWRNCHPSPLRFGCTRCTSWKNWGFSLLLRTRCAEILLEHNWYASTPWLPLEQKLLSAVKHHVSIWIQCSCTWASFLLLFINLRCSFVLNLCGSQEQIKILTKKT